MQEVQMSTLDVIKRVGTHQTCWHYGTLIIDTVFQHHTIREIHFPVNAFSYQVLEIRTHKNPRLVSARCYVFALALPTH